MCAAFLGRMAPMAIVIGYGDGALVDRLAAEPNRCLLVIALPGETPRRPATVNAAELRVARIDDVANIRALIQQALGDHRAIPPLAGCTIIDDHPLSPDLAAERDRMRPHLIAALTDMPQLYGNDIVDSLMGVHHCAQNAGRILAGPSPAQMVGVAGTTPAIAIGAGPSLREHIDELHALRDRCLLVSCISALPGLLRAGIEPHLVTPLERLQQDAPLVEGARGTRCVFAGLPVCHPDTVAGFDRHVGVCGLDAIYTWLWDDAAKGAVMTGSSTGVLAVSVALACTRGPVFLVGHDLCRDGDASHWSGADYSARLWRQVHDAQTAYGTGYETRIVPGNDGTDKAATVWWDRFRGELALLGRHSRRLWNVNAHARRGARIDATHAGPLPDPRELQPFSFALPPGDANRLADFRARARRLPDDAADKAAACDALADDIDHSLRGDSAGWDVARAMQRANEILAGGDNAGVFAYCLRSAVHNQLAFQHAELRRVSHGHRHSVDAARYHVCRDVRDLCRSLAGVIRHAGRVWRDCAGA